MRFVVARRSGRRGEGLGNEILPWAKGWIASQVLRAHQVGPAWGLNWRKYYRNFGTSRLDVVAEEFLAHLPHHAFTSQDYQQSGEIDFGKAIEQWAAKRGLLNRSAFVVTVDGMYGGYPAIRNARPFLWSKILNSRDALNNAFEIASKLDRRKLFVAVHMRLGSGFETLAPGESPQGKFNTQIPGEWYLSVCQALRDAMGDSLQFYFFTDRGGPAFDEAIRRFNPGQTRQPGLTECSDLLLMSQADLRICSLSSYSLAAAFLSDGLYVWYRPQLFHEDGQYTLWGMEDGQRLPGSPTRESIERMNSLKPNSQEESAIKGYTMDTGSALPRGLSRQLQHRLLASDRSMSLLEYGSLPDWTVETHSSTEKQ